MAMAIPPKGINDYKIIEKLIILMISCALISFVASYQMFFFFVTKMDSTNCGVVNHFVENHSY